MRKPISAVSLFSFAFTVAVMISSLSADQVIFSMSFNGDFYGNSAGAAGTLTIDTDQLVNPGTTSSGLKSFVGRVNLSIHHAAGGNGFFSSNQDVFFDVIIETGADSLDFSKELVGQPAGNSFWGNPDGASGDFRMFAIGPDVAAPSATDFFTITTSGGMGDSMLLTSLRPVDLVGDTNDDGDINLLDIHMFVNVLVNGSYFAAADINLDDVVDLRDVDPFVELLAGS